MRRLLAAGIAIVIALAPGCGKQQKQAGAEPGMWLPFTEGMELAAKQKKHVVIDFYTTWCVWCKRMDRQTFSDPEVKKFLAENFVTIRVDAEDTTQRITYQGKEHTPATLARRFGIRNYPTLVYLDREGELIRAVSGFMNASQFLSHIQGIVKE
jgi:thioredoxin-related protein